MPPLVCIPGIAGTADVYYKQIMSLCMKVHTFRNESFPPSVYSYFYYLKFDIMCASVKLLPKSYLCLETAKIPNCVSVMKSVNFHLCIPSSNFTTNFIVEKTIYHCCLWCTLLITRGTTWRLFFQFSYRVIEWYLSTFLKLGITMNGFIHLKNSWTPWTSIM